MAGEGALRLAMHARGAACTSVGRLMLAAFEYEADIVSIFAALGVVFIVAAGDDLCKVSRSLPNSLHVAA